MSEVVGGCQAPYNRFMKRQEYDVIVIGIGSAGSRASKLAHDAGASVLAIEGGEELGGLCILRGCMPTKTLLETAHRVHDARDGERFGFSCSEPEIDFTAQMDRMRSLVARFKRAKVGSIENGGYELVRAKPRFTGSHTIEVDGTEVRGKTFVIATGSKVSPFHFDVPDGVRVLDSDDMFLLTEAPKSALVVGAGAVGLEFAQWLARMGSAITFSNRSPLLRKNDLDFGAELQDAMALEMDMRVPSTIKAVEALPAGRARVTLASEGADDHTFEVDWILNGTGRIPAVDGLELEKSGVDIGNRGQIQISESLQTNLPHIFFAGDVSGRSAILHEANMEGNLAGRNALRVAGLADGADAKIEDWDLSIPHVEAIFSDPPFASVGGSAVTFEAEGRQVITATKRFPEQGRGIVMGARHGLARLSADPKTGRILGCQILGPRADDLIHVPTTVMAYKGTAQDMVRLPWYHPTLSEVFIELAREVASQVEAS